MDDKKNVGFIPGLALLLAVLALVLISYNATKPTPSEEALEKAMDVKIENLANTILNEVKNADVVDNRIAHTIFERDLKNFENSLANVGIANEPTLQTEVAAIKTALENLKAKMAGKPVPTEEKPAAAPEPPAKAEKGKKK